MAKSLTEKTITGVNWSFINNYSNAIITIFVGIILARLLNPRDFGLIGMVIIFTGLADLFVTLGMGKSVIRIKNLTVDHVRVATTITIISGILIFAVFFMIAPIISEFFNESKLTPIIRVLSLIFIIKGINTVSFGQITRNLDFKTIMLINVSTSLMYGISSTVLAFTGFGVWSLVYGRLISSLLGCIITTLKFPVQIRPLIKKKEFSELAGFGAGISISNILFYATTNVDNLIIGKLLDSGALGLYTRAFNLVQNTMGHITAGIYNVLFPAFAAVQSDKARLRKAYLRTIQTVSYIMFPLLFSMLCLSTYIINGMYGVKWAASIPVFRILLIAGLLRVSLQYSGAIAHATGKVYSEAFRQLVYFILLSVFAYVLIRYNIEGVAYAVLIARFWMFTSLHGLALKIIESSWKEFFKAHIPAISNSVVMVLINLLFIFFIEKFTFIKSYEIKLLIAVFINIPSLLLAIVFIPTSIKGDTFGWLIEKYKKYIPGTFQKFYLSFNSSK